MKYILLILVITGCYSKVEKETTSRMNRTIQDTINLMDSNSEDDTDSILTRIAANSKTGGFVSGFITRDTLWFIVTDSLVEGPFGGNAYANIIKEQMPRIVFQDSISEADSLFRYVCLTYKTSFIKVFETERAFYPEGVEGMSEYMGGLPQLATIDSLNINDEEIILRYGIHVGMRKKDFLLTFFNEEHLIRLSTFDVYVLAYFIEDYPGLIFSFKDEILINIVSSWRF